VNPKFHIGQQVRIAPDPITGGLPVMRDSTLILEVGTIESVQFTGNTADRTARELATVALPDVGRDTHRRFLVAVNYLKAA
jgi:hypothetical protein